MAPAVPMFNEMQLTKGVLQNVLRKSSSAPTLGASYQEPGTTRLSFPSCTPLLLMVAVRKQGVPEALQIDCERKKEGRV